MRTLSWFLVFHALAATAVASYAQAADVDVAPGKNATRPHSEWTRVGNLPNLPDRISEELPLSDQSARGAWTAYVPLTDEFEDPTLDESKWMPKHRHWRGRQPSWFSPQNVALADGELRLTMKLDSAPEDLQPHGYHTYSSAAVHSLKPVKYGYFEVCAQPMNSAGSSSFWFAGSGNGWRTEIDVFELSGKALGFERRYNMNLHVFHTPESREHWNVGDHWESPWPLVDDFHVYGLDWNELEITYFVDGVPVRRVENTHWHQPIFMIFDSETMPNWLGLPEAHDLPSTFRIKYVRSWKRAVPANGGEN